ncbi:MAG: leucyl aminopeptidase [Deltaproteobacteria bacterium]|nr:leucyl aminopeptidase [Deltaproteobacteria bacterium]
MTETRHDLAGDELPSGRPGRSFRALKITVSSSDPLKFSADALAIGVAEGVRRTGLLRDLLKKLGATANKAIKRGEFTGKKGQLCDIATGGAIKAGRVFLVGLGNRETATFADVRLAAATAARAANARSCTTLSIVVHEDLAGLEAVVAGGAVLGAYRYERFKSAANVAKFPLAKVSLLTVKKVNAELREEVGQGQRLGDAVCIARDLVNTPSNELYPETLANFAKELAKEHKDAGLSCSVLGPKQLKDKGMVLIDAVGRGSERGPRFIHMKYRPPKSTKKLKRLVFVGKGITFDSGGLCIKPGPGMDEMKGDMGGAANVVALMAAVAVAQPEAEVHGLVAAAENMPDGNSYRPGDVFGSYAGKTVEIINTDAEGRLVLADALAYGVELEPDFMLDNATLTGACVVALGPTVSGYFTGDDGLADKLGAAAQTAGEAMWRLPLVEDLREKLKSDWADVKHMGDRWGGAITAGLFLREFVGKVPWIHVDVAGPSMADKAYGIYTKGGTGAGVLTFLQLIDDLISADGEAAS